MDPDVIKPIGCRARIRETVRQAISHHRCGRDRPAAQGASQRICEMQRVGEAAIGRCKENGRSSSRVHDLNNLRRWWSRLDDIKCQNAGIA